MPTTQDLINNYMQGLSQPNNPAPINMATADTGNYLQNQFFQLPAYQLAYGQNATSLDPVERFRQDPGYQFAMDQGLRQVGARGSQEGLLDSGATAKSAIQYAQGLADQNYQRYQTNQQSMFSDYQNRLSNLTNMGSTNTGNQNAISTGTNLAGMLGSLFGQQSNANLNTGSNISSLLANQGAFGANAYINTGAAQANNLLNGAGFQAQVGATNSASQAGSMNSLFSGLGSASAINPDTGKGTGMFGKGGIFGGLY